MSSPTEVPLPFLELPPELRNKIYSYALVPSGDRTIDIQHPQPFDDDGPKFRGYSRETNNALFLVCRSIYEEARVVFYNEAVFGFGGWVGSKLMLDFLHTRPESSLIHIRNIGISADEALKGWSTQTDHDESSYYDWATVCSILANKCTIRHLQLGVQYDEPEQTYPMDDNKAPVPVGIDITAAWAELLSKIRGVHTLEVFINGFADGSDISQVARKHNLLSLMQMRNTMLDPCHTLSPLCGTGIRISKPEQCQPADGSYWQIDMSINRYGNTDCWPEQRVNVRPDAWCGDCGCFMITERRKCPCTAMGELTRWTYTSNGNVWNKKAWRDRPLHKYLPKGITIGDYDQAMEYLDAGFLIDKQGVFDDCSLEVEEDSE